MKNLILLLFPLMVKAQCPDSYIISDNKLILCWKEKKPVIYSIKFKDERYFLRHESIGCFETVSKNFKDTDDQGKYVIKVRRKDCHFKDGKLKAKAPK